MDVPTSQISKIGERVPAVGGCEGSLLFRSGVTFIFGTHRCPTCSGAGQPVQHLLLCFPPVPVTTPPLCASSSQTREQQLAPPDLAPPRLLPLSRAPGAHPLSRVACVRDKETQLGQAFCCLQKLAALAGDASPPHAAVCSFHSCHSPSFGSLKVMLGPALCQASRKAAVGASQCSSSTTLLPTGHRPCSLCTSWGCVSSACSNWLFL